ncbi:hypothetical protein [Klebsiella pneumoniae]|uniref:hypothetical protein n=1 Tax=Klebsiella pneumoniae TaxID=573 RepID=UPI001CECBE4A|nr:hypothetical protein [Klebsiella pneumoniae]
MDTFLSIFPRYPPDIRVGVPVPGDLVFVSSCLVSLILDLVEKKTVVANCAATGYEYREKKATSMRKIHASVIFVTYIRVHFLFARRSRR